MNRSAAALAALTLLCFGCSSNQDRGESGRTRSLASVGSGALSRDVKLRLRATRDPLGAETFALLVGAPSGAAPSAVVLPSGEELALTPSADDASLVRAELARAPELGTYRFVWADEAFATSALVEGAPPAYPEFVHPLDQGLWFPEREPVRWTWSGSAGLFDLRLFDAQGLLVRTLPDLSGSDAELRDAPSGPGTLELAATSGSSTSRVRWESCARILLSVTR